MIAVISGNHYQTVFFFSPLSYFFPVYFATDALMWQHEKFMLLFLDYGGPFILLTPEVVIMKNGDSSENVRTE